MDIYRSERHVFSFAGEAAPGGYLDSATGTDSETGAGTLSGDQSPGNVNLNPGSTSVLLDSSAGYLADEYVQIGTGTTAEVRRIMRVTGNRLYLDYPTAFYHATGTACNEVAAAFSGTSYITFIPGAWDTINTADMTPEILPKYFLGANENRNFYYAYRGRKAFQGGIPGIVLLNGNPLRFPIGTVATTGTDVVGGGGSTLNAATVKGALTIGVSADAGNSDYTNGDYIQIGTSSSAEVRQIISGPDGTDNAQTFTLNYPLMLAHANGATLNEVTSPYTHTISESVNLDTMSWHIKLRDSAGTTANDFIRRWVGGKVNRATIGASEGGMLLFSFDDVIFQDMVHNQQYHSSIGSGTTEIAKYNGAIVDPSAVGSDYPHSGGALGTPSYPITEPYYFSQGSLTFFGVEFARIRNFSLSINNNLDPRYYIRDTAGDRVPYEIQEQLREYAMTATVALPDSLAFSATTRSLFKELLVEGNYGSGMAGFDMTLVFTRGDNNTITITLPSQTATTAGGRQGVFLRRAPHAITGESPLQVDLDMLIRNLSITVVDSLAVYP